MKKFLVFIFLNQLLISGFAQSNLYLGFEGGFLLDRYYYVNSKSYSLTQNTIGGLYGGFVGYRWQKYCFESGFYSFEATHPFVDYDYITGKPAKTSGYGTGALSFSIPFRAGIEFLLARQKVFIKPEAGFHLIISRDYSENQPSNGWGENVGPPWDNSYVPTSDDSTRAYGYIPSKTSFGVETSMTAGYRIKQKIDIYFKGSYLSSFQPLYYEVITHYSPDETVAATSSTSSSFLLQFGLKYFIPKKKDKNNSSKS